MNSEFNETTKKKPIVAIVGRPNVGKSTLFNRIIDWNKAIVEDIPGVTRDRIYEDTEWNHKKFVVVDTGGLEPLSDDFNHSLIKEQVDLAIEEADLIMFVLDGNDGLIPQDYEIIDYLRKTHKEILYVINKIDHEKHEPNIYDFHKLGITDFFHISALHNKNIYELLDEVTSKLGKYDDTEDLSKDSDKIRIAVVGKQNVGKSTLINQILEEDRLITSPVPGTTRDAVDSYYERDGEKYILIDTAGIRRKSKISFLIERYSVIRAIRTIERADIVLFLVDSQVGPTHHDSRLAQLIKSRNKGSIILLNKWDLAPKEVLEINDIEEITKDKLKVVHYAPVITISAITGKRVNRIFEKIQHINSNYTQKIPTNQLNKFLEQLKALKSPPVYKGKEIKFFYMTQPFNKPPTFILFTNSSKGIPENYKRFIEKQLRLNYDFEGVPIKLIFRDREGKEV